MTNLLKIPSRDLFSEELFKDCTDYEVGAYILGIWITYHAELKDVEPEVIGEEFISTTRNLDTNSTHLIPLEKSLRLAAQGEFERAGKIFRDWFYEGATKKALIEEVKTGKRRQKSNASKERPDPVSTFILSKLEVSPTLDNKAITKLVIERFDVEDDMIYTEHRNKGYSLKQLPSRISRIRKKLKEKQKHESH